jgi:hypothetical protein
VAYKDIDTRLPPTPPTGAPLEADVFIAKADDPVPEDWEQNEADTYFPGVRPDLLAAVRDDMLLRPAEADAWYHLWAVLKEAKEEDLEAASLRRVGFVELFEQAKEYRGRLVTVRGDVRQATYQEAYDNEYGIEGYWVCWLQPAGGPTSPIIVYALEMPDGFPSGEDLREEVTFTGFSYKRKAYQARGRSGGGETRTAPLVMAKIGQWTPPVTEEAPAANIWMIIAAVLGTAMLALGIAMFVYMRSSSVSDTAEQYSSLGKAKPDDLAALEQTDLGPDVGEKLDSLAAEEDNQ